MVVHVFRRASLPELAAAEKSDLKLGVLEGLDLFKLDRLRSKSYRRSALVHAGGILALIWLALGLAPHALAASENPRGDRTSSQHIAPPLTIGDFDGDQRPDLVTADIGQRGASRTVYKIAIELSSGARSTLNIAGPDGGLQLTSRDVNGDDWPDVIVTTAWTRRPVAVLLNDGQGNFRELSPEQFPGAFPDSSSSLAATSNEIRDSLAAIVSRYDAGTFKPVASLDAPYLARLQIPDSRSDSIVSRSSSFLGRAPPASLCVL
jgi:FG-GAP-like repeat